MTLTARQLGYAQTVLQTGQSMGITPLGIEIAFATVFVESNWLMYANGADPASRALPHDAVGSDGLSEGLFQQQPPWWGTVQCRMDAACSAGLFFAALQQQPYNSGQESPGSYAQAVQQSAYPDRYDQLFPQAVALYNQLAKGDSGVTLYYPDVSNNNWDTFDDATKFLSQLKPEGFSGVVHKVSEGSYYADPFWPTVREWCENNDLPWLGYHYVTTDNPSAQAANWVANNGGPFAMFDVEANSGDLVNFWAVVNAFNAAGVNVTVAYIPQWYFDEVGGDLSLLAPNGVSLVSSAYPAGAGYASTIYAEGGGDSGEGWAPYGGGTPQAWQFTDEALIAGITVDCNAYHGTDLNQLFTGVAA